MKRSGHVYYRHLQAEERLIARITRTQETEAMLVQQDGFLYPNWLADYELDREVEAHKVGEGHWVW